MASAGDRGHGRRTKLPSQCYRQVSMCTVKPSGLRIPFYKRRLTLEHHPGLEQHEKNHSLWSYHAESHTNTGTESFLTLVQSHSPHWYRVIPHTGTESFLTLVQSHSPHWYRVIPHTGTESFPTLVQSHSPHRYKS